jgi:hypothetical protein
VVPSEKLGDWERSDDAKAVHRKLSPNCPLVLGMQCGNVPRSEKVFRLFACLRFCRSCLRIHVGDGDVIHALGLVMLSSAWQPCSALNIPFRVVPTHESCSQSCI